MALRITRVVAPLGISANAVTLVAWFTGAAAAAALAWGTLAGWLIAALLLQVWYLLDHVDGQLARLHGTQSLDGAQLDYLMHHTVHMLVPLGAGTGLFVNAHQPWWFVLGLLAAVATLVIGLRHDAGYRAFFSRLEQLDGALLVIGRARQASGPEVAQRRTFLRAVAYTARKLAEIHVAMNLLALVAVLGWVLDDRQMVLATAYLALNAMAAVGVAAWTVGRSQRQQSVEGDFSRWFRLPEGADAVYCQGRWMVVPRQDGENRQFVCGNRPMSRDSS